MSKKIAVLTEETIHDLEFWYPYYRLAEEGYDLVIVGPEAGKSYTGKMGGVIRSEKSPSEISAKDFAGVVVPGGWGPDKLRTHKAIVDFVRDVHATAASSRQYATAAASLYRRVFWKAFAPLPTRDQRRYDSRRSGMG